MEGSQQQGKDLSGGTGNKTAPEKCGEWSRRRNGLR